MREIRLQHPIEVAGQPKSVIQVRHDLRVGDLAAVTRYAMRHGLPTDISQLFQSGDLGALLALMESLCQLPAGVLDQLHPDDITSVMTTLDEVLRPFGDASPVTGLTASVR